MLHCQIWILSVHARHIGVEFLSLVLDRCPPEKLTRQSGSNAVLEPPRSRSFFFSTSPCGLLLQQTRGYGDNNTCSERIAFTFSSYQLHT